MIFFDLSLERFNKIIGPSLGFAGNILLETLGNSGGGSPWKMYEQGHGASSLKIIMHMLYSKYSVLKENCELIFFNY
jgi:hypothetical protein